MTRARFVAAHYVADFGAADVHELPRRRIGREIEKEFAVPRPRKQIRDALARKRAALLLHQRFDVRRASSGSVAVTKRMSPCSDMCARLVRSRRRVEDERLAT